MLSKEPDEDGNVAVAFCRSANMPVVRGESVDLVDAAVAHFGALWCVLFHCAFPLSLHGLPCEPGSPSERTNSPFFDFGQRDRLRTEYKALYPRSSIYQMTLLCAFTLIVLAALFAGIRIWEAATGT